MDVNVHFLHHMRAIVTEAVARTNDALVNEITIEVDNADPTSVYIDRQQRCANTMTDGKAMPLPGTICCRPASTKGDRDIDNDVLASVQEAIPVPIVKSRPAVGSISHNWPPRNLASSSLVPRSESYEKTVCIEQLKTDRHEMRKQAKEHHISSTKNAGFPMEHIAAGGLQRYAAVAAPTRSKPKAYASRTA